MPAKLSRGDEIFVRSLSLLLEIPPAAYVAVTGHAPTWIRIWMSAWLIVWLVFIVAQSLRAQVKR